MREAGATPDAPAPIGPYSQSVRIGRLVHAAGLAGELRVEIDALAVLPE